MSVYFKVNEDGCLDGISYAGCITIPDSVKSIGYRALADHGKIVSITIPDSVTSIGERAFAGCSSLERVTIGNGVTSIGRSAFFRCLSLKRIRVPKHFDAHDAAQWGLPDTCEIIWY